MFDIQDERRRLTGFIGSAVGQTTANADYLITIRWERVLTEPDGFCYTVNEDVVAQLNRIDTKGGSKVSLLIHSCDSPGDFHHVYRSTGLAIDESRLLLDNQDLQQEIQEIKAAHAAETDDRKLVVIKLDKKDNISNVDDDTTVQVFDYEEDLYADYAVSKDELLELFNFISRSLGQLKDPADLFVGPERASTCEHSAARLR